MDYSRLSRADLVTERVNLQAVVEKALAQLESDIRKSQARVTVDGPLPDVVGHWTALVRDRKVPPRASAGGRCSGGEMPSFFIFQCNVERFIPS